MGLRENAACSFMIFSSSFSPIHVYSHKMLIWKTIYDPVELWEKLIDFIVVWGIFLYSKGENLMFDISSYTTKFQEKYEVEFDVSINLWKVDFEVDSILIIWNYFWKWRHLLSHISFFCLSFILVFMMLIRSKIWDNNQT